MERFSDQFYVSQQPYVKNLSALDHRRITYDVVDGLLFLSRHCLEIGLFKENKAKFLFMWDREDV